MLDFRVSLGRDEFRKLVRGGTVVIEGMKVLNLDTKVSIILEDIGYDTMCGEILEASEQSE